VSRRPQLVIFIHDPMFSIAGGLLIAGALAAWVPHSFWQGLFLTHHPTLGQGDAAQL
jgi:hypothetical protein